ncbi:MAG: ferrochelatase [Candidatus Acidiferrales bacterium]
MKKIAIVLFQLGGPDTTAAVEPFLYNLFCDPDIIDFPMAWIARRALAKFISTRRSKVVAEHYREIGGGSPIRFLTERQGAALEEMLAPWVQAKTIVAMRYWHPLTSEAIAALMCEKYDDLVLLPLYPHYSFATTKSSLKEWNRQTRDGLAGKGRLVESFYNHPLYIESLRARVDEKLSELQKPDDVFLVFSAHGLPMKLVKAGDPYPQQIEETMRLVLARGGWANRRVLCYQSRVGPQKWLEPSLTQAIERLANEGVKRMLVIPISFVTDHIETLHEINIEAREEAEKLGVEEFTMTGALNDSVIFIRALADLVLKAAGFEKGIDTPRDS